MDGNVCNSFSNSFANFSYNFNYCIWHKIDIKEKKMNLLFIAPGNIVLLVVLLALLIAYPILMMRRNKKEQERQQNLISSLKKGEYVITYSGIFGKITEIIEKEVGKFIVIETGEKNKSYATVSENAIYTVTNNNPKIYNVEGEEIKKDNNSNLKAVEEGIVEEKNAEKNDVKAEDAKKVAGKKPSQTKSNTPKSSTKKASSKKKNA